MHGLQDKRINLSTVSAFGGGAVILFAVVSGFKQRKRLQKEVVPTPVEPECTTLTTRATVIEQTCCVKTVGTKTPKTIKVFTVVFQTETGNILKLNVPEEMYDGFEQGQTGRLSLVDGQLYGFELE